MSLISLTKLSTWDLIRCYRSFHYERKREGYTFAKLPFHTHYSINSRPNNLQQHIATNNQINLTGNREIKLRAR